MNARSHQPTRTCIGCKTTQPKRELVRYVLVEGNRVVADTQQRRDGRGAYLCESDQCFALARRRRAFSRAFRCFGFDTDISGLVASGFHP